MSTCFKKHRPVVAIVDAVSAGALVTLEMAEHYDLIHIQSDVAVNALSHPRFHKHHFKAFYYWDPSQAEKCLEQIALHNPLAVIPGHESAVKLSEEIAWRLSEDGNDPATTILRRNKFFMNEAVSQAGLETVKQAVSDDPGVLKNWFRQYGQSKVVVKPLDSAGSDDVYICTSETQVEDAARTITGKNNSMHSRNDKALIQQFIEGKEYVVNTVSLNGKHKVTDVWRVSKKTLRRQKSL
ncbi:ATP-grasp domain-containing protein [Acerihabitans sp. KWT182]|uniref:ATP-grasp domain-containing protein n=1 Tax=Acerihabitans sp. KWT182 TaxID=3157919 RepID=A0AAU7QAP3_9GAMM